MSRLKKKSQEITGVLNGLNDEEKSKRVKVEKSNKKLKRSYMLSKDTIQKLKLLEIQEVDITLSELVEEAIELLYNKRIKE